MIKGQSYKFFFIISKKYKIGDKVYLNDLLEDAYLFEKGGKENRDRLKKVIEDINEIPGVEIYLSELGERIKGFIRIIENQYQGKINSVLNNNSLLNFPNSYYGLIFNISIYNKGILSEKELSDTLCLVNKNPYKVRFTIKKTLNELMLGGIIKEFSLDKKEGIFNIKT